MKTTNLQLKSINKELTKLGIIGLNKPAVLPTFTDFKLLKDERTGNVFMSYIDISIPEQPKSILKQFFLNGSVEDDATKLLEFNSIAERIDFMNNLKPIKL